MTCCCGLCTREYCKPLRLLPFLSNKTQINSSFCPYIVCQIKTKLFHRVVCWMNVECCNFITWRITMFYYKYPPFWILEWLYFTRTRIYFWVGKDASSHFRFTNFITLHRPPISLDTAKNTIELWMWSEVRCGPRNAVYNRRFHPQETWWDKGHRRLKC